MFANQTLRLTLFVDECLQDSLYDACQSIFVVLLISYLPAPKCHIKMSRLCFGCFICHSSLTRPLVLYLNRQFLARICTRFNAKYLCLSCLRLSCHAGTEKPTVSLWELPACNNNSQNCECLSISSSIPVWPHTDIVQQGTSHPQSAMRKYLHPAEHSITSEQAYWHQSHHNSPQNKRLLLRSCSHARPGLH